MSQDGILKVLKKHKKWMNTKEIAKKLKIENGSTLRALNSLYKYKEVFKRKIKRDNYWIYEWKIK